MGQRQMHLVALLCAGPTIHHNGGWRHPQSDGHLVLDPARYEEIARICERGLFDGIFFADYHFIQDLRDDRPSLIARHGGQMAMLEPMQLLAIMARVTRHIGLAATLSTTFFDAYTIARAMATLDHLSHGRAGWNIVTTGNPAEAANHGLDGLKLRTDRYDYADEVIEACQTLWQSWAPDALLLDKASGNFADPDKVRHVRYDGANVRLKGALTAPRSPQGEPVLMQAGSSERGRQFAARWAEAVFTVQQSPEPMRAFYCAILPAIDVIAGAREAEALTDAAEVDALASIELGLQTLTDLSGVDMRSYPPDTPIADIPIDPERTVSIGLYQNVLDVRKDGRGLTLKEAAHLYATTWMAPRLVGTPESIVDQMQDMFETGCCDGFVIGTSTSPVGLRKFADLIVPELQRRGLFRLAYDGATFRDNLRAG